MGKDEDWQGVRTVGRLRFERNLKPPVEKDSLYHVICSRFSEVIELSFLYRTCVAFLSVFSLLKEGLFNQLHW